MLILAEILEALLRYHHDVRRNGRYRLGLGVSPYTRRRHITSLHLPVCPIKSPGTEAGDKTPPRIHLVRRGDSSKTSVSKYAWERFRRGHMGFFTFSQQGTHSRQVTPKRNLVSEVFLYACLCNCSVTRAARICLGALVHSKDRRFRPMRMGGGTSTEIGVVASVTSLRVCLLR